jgi:hypothetical protein
MQQLVVIQMQVIAWKPHNWTLICWGFFVVIDNLPMDLEKPQMLQCIICKTEQANAFVLCQWSTLWKGLIKFGKINGITPMRTHVEFAHPKLVIHRKLAIVEELVTTIPSHSQ